MGLIAPCKRPEPQVLLSLLESN